IVEPDSLGLLCILASRIAIVIAVVLKPEAVDFDILPGAPPDAGELSYFSPIHPYCLTPVRLVGRGVCLQHELPTLPPVERRNDALWACGSALARARREEGIAPVFVHLRVDFHVRIVAVEVDLARRRVLAPGEPGFHAGDEVRAVGLETCLAER